MMGVFNGLMTLFLIVIFIGIFIWAWSKRNKDKFDKMAQLPLVEDSASIDDALTVNTEEKR